MTTTPLGKPELEKLADALRRLRGTAAYPPTAKKLLENAGVTADAIALTTPAAAKHVRTSAKRPAPKRQSTKPPPRTPRPRPDDYFATALVFVPEDASRIAVSEGLVVHLLALARTERTHIHAISTLADLLPSNLAKDFARSTRERVEGASSMPDGVGCLRVEGHRKLFLLADMRSSDRALAVDESDSGRNGHEAVPVPPPPPPPFPDAFRRAFEELDQESGRHNYVLLHDLRKRLSAIPRPDFDRGLNELRRSELYSLDSADGRHVRLTPEQREAGIREAGSLLVYVARR
jgi:hypothetical protein